MSNSKDAVRKVLDRVEGPDPESRRPRELDLGGSHRLASGLVVRREELGGLLHREVLPVAQDQHHALAGRELA